MWGMFLILSQCFTSAHVTLNYTEKYLFYWSESGQKQYFLFLEVIKLKDAVESKIQGVNNLAEEK